MKSISGQLVDQWSHTVSSQEAPEDYQEPDEEDGEDGLTMAILEARSENQITIDMW